MGRKFQFSLGEFYHLYNRGNDKKVIFLDDGDRGRFIRLLFLCNTLDPLIFKLTSKVEPWKVIHSQGSTLDRKEAIIDIGAYCLMPNHFHILVHERIENGISQFMQKLSTAYTMYFNKKYQRSGTIFEGRFKATFVDEDSYLEYLFSYIHLNPIKLMDPEWKERGLENIEGAKKFLNDYSHSSYLDYIGRKRREGVILSRAAFPEYFHSPREFEYFLDHWLNFPKVQFQG